MIPQITFMEPYIAENKAETSHNIFTITDPTSGRWPSQSINGLLIIARKCLESKVNDRATIEQVNVVTQVVWLHD